MTTLDLSTVQAAPAGTDLMFGPLETYPKPRPFKVPRKLKVIVVVMVVCAVLGLLSIAVASKKKTTTTGPYYEGFAKLVAQNYVNGHPLDVPRAQGITTALGRQAPPQTPGQVTSSTTTTPQPLGAAAVTFDHATDVSSRAGTIETDYFWVEGQKGTLALLAVVVHGTPAGPVLGAAPTLLPAPKGSVARTLVASGKPVVGSSSTLSQNFIKQIDAWAKAFASGDRTALYTLTGDTKPATFPGLGDYKLVGTPVVVSMTTWDPKKPVSKLVVTVEVTMVAATNSKVVTESSYDLLLTGLGNALPNVAAWGPAGSGATLVPYENAAG